MPAIFISWLASGGSLEAWLTAAGLKAWRSSKSYVEMTAKSVASLVFRS